MQELRTNPVASKGPYVPEAEWEFFAHPLILLILLLLVVVIGREMLVKPKAPRRRTLGTDVPQLDSMALGLRAGDEDAGSGVSREEHARAAHADRS